MAIWISFKTSKNKRGPDMIRLTLNFEAEATPYFAMVEEKLYFLAGSCFLLEGGRERLRVN